MYNFKITLSTFEEYVLIYLEFLSKYGLTLISTFKFLFIIQVNVKNKNSATAC